MRLKKRILCLLLTSLFMTVVSGCGGVSETEDTADLFEKIIGTEGQENASYNTEGTDITSETEAMLSDEESEEKESEDEEENTMVITVNGTELTAVMEDNSSVAGLMELLADGPLTIEMSDYANMEKVGSIGTNLPRNDKQITTGAGDLILYQGNSFVIYYDTNSWSLTRLGRIQDITADELKELLGDGNVTVTLSLPD